MPTILQWVTSLGEYLLINPDTGKLRPDNKAILALHTIADGDTEGPKRFINNQSEIVPEFVGKSDNVPDIGHLIKCISAGWSTQTRKGRFAFSRGSIV